MTTTRTHFAYKQRNKLCHENSAHSIPSEVTEQQGFWRLGSNYRTFAIWICFSSVIFWLICQTNAIGTIWKCQNVLPPTGKIDFHKVLVETLQVYFVRSWQASLTWCIQQNLCRFWECYSTDLFKKSATRRVTLKRSFFIWLHHASSSFAMYGQNRPEQGWKKRYDFSHDFFEAHVQICISVVADPLQSHRWLRLMQIFA